MSISEDYTMSSDGETHGDRSGAGTDNWTHTSDNTVNLTMRPGDRSAKQKLSIPTLDKRDITGAKLWWRRFVQYIKMTHGIDLSEMTTDKEIRTEYCEQLDAEIKDTFIWALGETAMKEMTRTVREREPGSLPLHKLYSLFRLQFIPKRNKYHSRADFFELKRSSKESAADIWTKILEIEKNCEFEEITAAELIASKFISMIGKSTGDNELKKRIKKSDMAIETITDLIHEYMYEKQNESSDTSTEVKRIKHISKEDRKRRWDQTRSRQIQAKQGTSKLNEMKTNQCWNCGSANWSKFHNCPEKEQICRNCKKKGHFVHNESQRLILNLR